MPSLGISDEVLEAALARRTGQKDRDGRVCICGHPARCHSSMAGHDNPAHSFALSQGGEVCIQTRVLCPCERFEPVIEVDDSRLFKFKTRGAGQEHALAQGMMAVRQKARRKVMESYGEPEDGGDSVHRAEAAQAAQDSIRFLDGFACRFCGTQEGLTPVPYRVVNSQIVSEADTGTPFNALVCEDCRKAKMVEVASRG